MSSKFKELMAQARSRQVEDGGDLTQETPKAQKEAQTVSTPTPITPEVVPTLAPKATSQAALERAAQPALNTQPVMNTELALDEHQATDEHQAASAARRRGRPRGKRSHPDFEQVSAYISKRTHVQVKIALLQEGEGREFSELVEELLSIWLKQ